MSIVISLLNDLIAYCLAVFTIFLLKKIFYVKECVRSCRERNKATDDIPDN